MWPIRRPPAVPQFRGGRRVPSPRCTECRTSLRANEQRRGQCWQCLDEQERRERVENEVAVMLAGAMRAGDVEHDRAHAAIHEAAHAVALTVYGLPFDEVSIDDHGGGSTVRSADEGPTWSIEAAVVTLLAGPQAERRAFDEVDEWAVGSDEERVAAILERCPERAAEFRAMADALVVEHEESIRMLAYALEQRGVVPAADALAIIAEHDGQGDDLDERLAELDLKYRLAPGTCRDLADGALAELRGDRPTEVRSTVAVARPATADLWPPRARELYQAMHTAGDLGDWATFRELQDELADIQRPLIWST